MSDTIKYIIEALRQKPREPGITRDPGDIPRRMAGPLFGGSPVSRAQKEAQYNRYLKVQSSSGESPVSYEEWLQK
jgi:hypothetical protein